MLMSRRKISRTAFSTLALVIVALSALPATTTHAQRVVVRPGRGGGAVVAEPRRRGGGAVVVQPGRRSGSVVVAPERPRAGVVVQPPRRGAEVVVQPPRRGGGVVVAPPSRPGVVVVGPRGVVRSAPARVRVVAPPPPPRPRVRWSPPSRHGEVWIEPYWGWTGASWEWIEGHWEQPPQLGAVWVPPQHDGAGWVPGYWTTPRVSVPATYGTPYHIGMQLAGSFSGAEARDAQGAVYQDYVVAMSAGETATFSVIGGPSPQDPSRRIDVMLQVLSNGAFVANGSTQTGVDSHVTLTSPQAAVYVIRVASRSGVYGGTYLVQSGRGVQPDHGYDDYWGGGQVPQAQAYPDCRRTLIELGHSPSSFMFCDGAEPYCADALLRAGHAPTNLMFCQGVDPQCAVSILGSGRAPAELQYCR